MSFEIETNIPLPAGYLKRSRQEYPFDQLKVGDSFAIQLGDRKSWSFIFAAIQEAQKRLGIKLATRLIDDKSRRIWRVS